MAGSGLNTVLNLMKERVSLSRIVRQDVNLQKKGREFVGHCPFHNEKTGSFFVNDDKGTFYCFGCGASGDVVEYLMRKRGIQFMQAIEVLSEISGIKIPEKVDRGNDVLVNQQKVLQKTLEFFKAGFSKSSDAIAYCKNRGITEALIEKFSIGYAPKDGSVLLNYLKKANFSVNDIVASGVFAEKNGRLICRFKDRIMFPVFNRKGWPIAFGGRGIQKDAVPKYINSPETEMFQKRETLYGYNIAIKNISKTIPFILVEGYMDVVMMNKFSYDTAVASMGTAFSSQHLAKLWKYSSCPVICLDGDSAGYNAMVKIAFLAMPYLQPGKSLKFCKIPGDDDPDSFLKTHSKSEMDQLISKSENLIDFIWNYFLREFSSMENKTPENIAEWKKEIFGHIEGIQNLDIKKLYKQDIKGRILNLLGYNDRPKQIKNMPGKLRVFVDKNEKILLREAGLLYILMMRPSIISAVVEELATVEFSNKDLEKLRLKIVEEQESVSFEDFHEAVAKVRKIAGKSCSYGVSSDDEALRNWREIFDSGISKERMVEDLRAAKEECENSSDAVSWDRWKALKLDFLNRRCKK